MNKIAEHDTREHILATGEQLCLHRGFVGMGLSELLKTAEVPKGSFYHYFRSKEAFGVAMLERYYTAYHQRLTQHFSAPDSTAREKLLAHYQQTLQQFCQHDQINGCLTVKLSAEVCDLSEDMRVALDRGAAKIIALLAESLAQGVQEGSLRLTHDAVSTANVLYALWLGASLQAKISRSALPLESALGHVKALLSAPE
ncbi:TetR/AcrR family transcriptional regulator [Atlantibacter subterranea]|uniref:TetR/AcrR family transcriptional regulator n=1 Tax=Atlantibacter subterraneus TaxID=255519 RepID=A0A427V1L3_9ENTR|nr:TetR/AcrR family transcriptional regulator [Atlantibacter subterranea]MDA3133498.1 TetR/AcrR family transcriptional regulator [Atlantibacter subterranea]MDW2743274.1 TetR/AcrR family transcriptional regulator [Atlantibacter subterranea]RSB62684.1 TetR/AcrR family transcriptional regulator [Atlantibacter subterranea]RSE01885.1 TetR/AcrR family transcriptional regulator [Atlantibacter subterranea]RSE26666.1 TetR/AcrR family transcriptional regulator [Atlantibacter subterranea]